MAAAFDTTHCSVMGGEEAAPAGVVELAATVAPLVAGTPVSVHGATQAVLPPGVANGVAAPLAGAALPTSANGTPAHAKGAAAQTPPATGVCLCLACVVCVCVRVYVCMCSTSLNYLTVCSASCSFLLQSPPLVMP